MSDLATSEVPVDLHHVDDINVRAIVMWGVISIVITVISILGLHALYNSFELSQIEVKSFGAEYKTAANEIDKQQGKLVAAPNWVDKAAGVVTLPIDQAMEITIEEYKGNGGNEGIGD